MAMTRKAVRRWHLERLAELQHQHDMAYLFTVSAEDQDEMESALFLEWCALSTAAKMEVPPEHYLRSGT